MTFYKKNPKKQRIKKDIPNGKTATNPFGSLLDAAELQLNAGGVKPAALSQ